MSDLPLYQQSNFFYNIIEEPLENEFLRTFLRYSQTTIADFKIIWSCLRLLLDHQIFKSKSLYVLKNFCMGLKDHKSNILDKYFFFRGFQELQSLTKRKLPVLLFNSLKIDYFTHWCRGPLLHVPLIKCEKSIRFFFKPLTSKYIYKDKIWREYGIWRTTSLISFSDFGILST